MAKRFLKEFECFECNAKWYELDIEREVEHTFADDFIIRYYVECPECGDRDVLEEYEANWDDLTFEDKERLSEFNPALQENWSEDAHIAYEMANRLYGSW